MRDLPDSTRSSSDSTQSGETGDVAEAFTGKDFYQDLIDRANTVPLTRLFKLYGVRVDEHNTKTTCPFKHHKGGRENTPSFYYYPHTNSFCCYGCHTGHKHAHGVEFVAAYEGIKRMAAAYKILDQFGSEVDEDNILTREDFSEQLEIMVSLSDTIREFRQKHTDAAAFDFIEDKCRVYDDLNSKFKKLDNSALRRIVEEIKEEISSYTPCQTP